MLLQHTSLHCYVKTIWSKIEPKFYCDYPNGRSLPNTFLFINFRSPSATLGGSEDLKCSYCYTINARNWSWVGASGITKWNRTLIYMQRKQLLLWSLVSILPEIIKGVKERGMELELSPFLSHSISFLRRKFTGFNFKNFFLWNTIATRLPLQSQLQTKKTKNLLEWIGVK